MHAGGELRDAGGRRMRRETRAFCMAIGTGVASLGKVTVNSGLASEAQLAVKKWRPLVTNAQRK
jgi:hypothetical protein